MPFDDSLAGLYVWDPWPVLDEGGQIASVGGQEWWIALAAPRALHPEARHDHARLRWLRLRDDGWHDAGPVFPNGASPGSREWSGTAVYDADSGTMRVLYTAVGARAEVGRSFRQRLFETRGTVIADAVSDWSTHLELLPVADPYLRTEPGACSAEVCRAYRDPFFFQDPVTGHQHLVFAASVSDPAQPHAGAIGLATWRLGRWQPDPPLLTALGVNRELERPHLLARDNRYYLFVSTHGHSFTVDHPAPSGLYGFTAPALTGPWEPLNDTGIVLANPPEAPQAHYAWQVLPDLRIVSFGNYPHEPPGTLAEDAAFAGSIPPFRHLRIDGSRTQVS